MTKKVFRRRLLAVILTLVLMLSVFAVSASAIGYYGFRVNAKATGFGPGTTKSGSDQIATVYVSSCTEAPGVYVQFAVCSSQNRDTALTEWTDYSRSPMTINYTKTASQGRTYYLGVYSERRVIDVQGYWYP